MYQAGMELLKIITDAGYEAYFVGGCVRDILLNRPYSDIDITTSATPKTVMALFEKTIPTGVDYGTVTVIHKSYHFEVTTFRKDMAYDGRRPKVVSFSKNLLDDLSRRDFTMNAMAMDMHGGITDPFGGQSDLSEGILRFVGNPSERIEEDKLRVLRFVRFLCTYNLASGDLDALSQLKLDIRKLSSERIRDEFNKMMLSSNPKRAIHLLTNLGLLDQFFKELSDCQNFKQNHPAHSKDVYDHTLDVLCKVNSNLYLRLAALCHDLGKVHTRSTDDEGCDHFYGHSEVSEELTRDFMKRLKYSNLDIESVSTLVKLHMRLYETVTKPSAKRLIQKVGIDLLPLLFELQRADTTSCNGDRALFVKNIDEMEYMCQAVLQEEAILKVTDLNVNGYDLMAAGYKGKEIKEKLLLLLDAVIDEKSNNEREALLTYLSEQGKKVGK